MTAAELLVPLAAGAATHLAMWAAGAWARERILGSGAVADGSEGAAFQSAMLGFAILGTVTFALAAAGLLYRPLVTALLVAGVVAGSVRLVRAWPRMRPHFTPADVPMLASVGFVLASLLRALMPVLEHDESVYHLLLPKLYLAAHALIPLPWSLGANMPHLVDLACAVPMAVGGFTAAKVFVHGFIVWTLIGFVPIGRAMLGPIGPGVLSVLFLSGPLLQWHFGLAYVEPVIGALMLGAVLSLLRYVDGGPAAELVMMGLLAGAGCASKYTVWPHTALLFLLAVVLRPPGERRIVRPVLVWMAACCAVMVVPWMVKNAIVTGNPIFPNANAAFGGHYWSKIQEVQFQHEMGYGRGAEATLAAYASLPLHLVTEPYPGRLGAASFSASALILILASLLFPWRGRDGPTLLRVLTIAAFAFWCLGPKQSRYLVTFLPILILAASIPLMALRARPRALAAVTVLIASLSVVHMTVRPYPKEPLRDVFTVSRKELLARNLCWDLTELLNRIVPPGGKVYSFWENRLYFLDRPFVADSAFGAPTSLARLREAKDPHVFAKALAAEGVTHVVINPYFYQHYMANRFLYSLIDDAYYPPDRLAADGALMESFMENELDLIPWDGAWAVCALKAARAAEPR